VCVCVCVVVCVQCVCVVRCVYGGNDGAGGDGGRREERRWPRGKES